jgi:phenylpropionate dioxygenase-like ring-hydroxylating dioxygenase large terminal subunit
MATATSELVDNERGLVSRRIFADREVYELELERIFSRVWLFLGHESQVAKPGDFVQTRMGNEPVILTRNAQGQIRAMINSCRHRGNRVCRVDQGRTSRFMCTYHGWTYDLDGKLVGVPGYEERYYEELDREQWGLIPVAQVASYKGLVFGTFDASAPPLEEYLGDARWALDYILDQHPGGTEVVGGVFKWIIKSNWKLGADNIMGDNYHGGITHKSATMAGHQTGHRFEGRVRGNDGAERNGSGDRDPRSRLGFTAPLEWGHGFMCDLQPGSQLRIRDDRIGKYYQETMGDLRARLGDIRSRVWKINLTVFPNASFTTGSNMLHVWHPLGPTATEVWLYIIVDKEAPPEVKRDIRLLAQRHFSPAGMFEQDDMDNWEQSTQAAAGMVARRYPLNYTMGLGHEQWTDGGEAPRRIETIMDESNQRTFYRGWAEFLSDKSWAELVHDRAMRQEAARTQAEAARVR